MKDFLTYLLEVNVLLLIFAGAYFLIFRNERHLLFNRGILNGFVAVSFILPLLRFSTPAILETTVWLDPIPISAGKIESIATAPDLTSVLSWLYLAGASLSLFLFVRQLIAVSALLKNATRIPGTDFREVSLPGLAPGSFMRTVFRNSDLSAAEDACITAHEMVHIREKHTVDLLIFRVVRILCWFNPAIYFLEHMLEENHECRADEIAAKSMEDHCAYSRVLLSETLGVSPALLTHRFSKPKLLKKRIAMLNKPNTPKNKLRYLLLIPVLALAVGFHSCTKEEPNSGEENAEQTPAKSQMIEEAENGSGSKTGTSPLNLPYAEKGEDGVYNVVEKMPEFPGGDQALMTYLGNAISYPDGAKSIESSGTVFISFVIDETGAVTDTEIVQSPDPALSAVALQAVNQMPEWTPGEHNGEPVKVRFALPIKFALE